MHITNEHQKFIFSLLLLPAISLYPYLTFGQESLHPDSIAFRETSKQERTEVFYNTLELKSDKTPLAHKLHNLIIVSPDSTNINPFTKSGNEYFEAFKGLRIRNIEVQRLNVFGTDILNPSFQDSSRIDRLMNKTHIKTTEGMIRKYLLFVPGDQISPLELSENERIIRQLPFIEDARILITPVSGNEADIIIIVKDVYSLGHDISLASLEKGTFKFFERNIFGIGHELEFVVPFDSYYKDSPGFGVNYKINNIGRTFSNLNFSYFNGLGRKTYGASLSREFLTSYTKYAGGISVRKTFTTIEIDSILQPKPLEFSFQDYWLARSFLVNEEAVTRIIVGARYTNNNIFTRPEIYSNSYHSLQEYQLYMGSAAISMQKYYKTNLIYNFGRTEDIPYGMLFCVTAGREFNEFKVRTYLGADIAAGKSFEKWGYNYLSTGYSTFINNNSTEQGLLNIRLNHFSNLYKLGRLQIRNFFNLNYTKGYSRYTDEYLIVNSINGMPGFTNDSLRGNQRIVLNLESVIFSPINIYGFRFVFFGFTDIAKVKRSDPNHGQSVFITGLGVGVRIRNDNLVLNTFQIRLGYFPNPPSFSNLNYLRVSGEQLLRPADFDTGPPEVITYR